MEQFTVFKNSCAAGLLSFDGVCGSTSGMKTAREIKEAIKNLGVYVTLWNGDKITFLSVYSHTQKVPKKALQNLDGLKSWIIDRAKYYYNIDGKKIGIL